MEQYKIVVMIIIILFYVVLYNISLFSNFILYYKNKAD